MHVFLIFYISYAILIEKKYARDNKKNLLYDSNHKICQNKNVNLNKKISVKKSKKSPLMFQSQKVLIV